MAEPRIRREGAYIVKSADGRSRLPGRPEDRETGRDAPQRGPVNWGLISALLFCVVFWLLVAVAVMVLA